MANVIPMGRFLNELRHEQHQKNCRAAISVYQDGSYEIWSQADAEYAAACQSDLLVTINLDVDLTLLAAPPPAPPAAATRRRAVQGSLSDLAAALAAATGPSRDLDERMADALFHEIVGATP